MLFDIKEIQHFQESNQSGGGKYTGDIDDYDFFNDLASREVFESSDWYESLAASTRPFGFSDDDKAVIVNHLKHLLDSEFEKFIISHCTTSFDGGYDCWIMDIAYEIISEKANDDVFLKWFSELFSSLSEQENSYIQIDDLAYGLWRVWTWHDERQAKKLFSNLEVDVDKMLHADAAIDEAYGSGW